MANRMQSKKLLKTTNKVQCIKNFPCHRMWNDEMCTNKGGFVCKKPKEGGWTTPTTTPFPKGDKLSDFLLFFFYFFFKKLISCLQEASSFSESIHLVLYHNYFFLQTLFFYLPTSIHPVSPLFQVTVLQTGWSSRDAATSFMEEV